MNTKTNIFFDVSAGKYDNEGEENCKFCKTFINAEEAVSQFEYVSDYPWARLDVCIDVDGATTTVNLLGGTNPEMMLRMRIASLWMKVTGQKFVDIAMDADVQLDEIENIIDNELECATWLKIKHAFDSGTLSWSQAFERLMSKCGMSMNEALQCIAEHFDRRPPIEVSDVE